MPGRANRLRRLWLELKRRKVIKTIAMYAGAAYVLIELSNNVVQPLNLPDWTPRLVIIILIIGFPITAILSWIFDLTPEGIRKTGSLAESEMQETAKQTRRRKLKLSDVVIAVLIVAVCVLLYPKIFGTDRFENIRDEDGRISIAVMPFENHTGDTTLDYLQKGISSLIINGLGCSEELTVLDDHTMHEVIAGMDRVASAGMSPSMARKAANLAKAETYISGSYQGTGDHHVILTNLVDTESGEIIWSKREEGNLTSREYLEVGYALCEDIRDYLEIEALKEDVDFDFREAYTQSSQAYRYYIEGMNQILSGDYKLAIESMKMALEIDSTFTFAAFYIAWSCSYGGLWEDIEIWTRKAYQGKEKLPDMYRYLVELWHACVNLEDREEIARYCDMLSRNNSRSRLFWLDLGVTYYSILQEYEKSLHAFEKVAEFNLGRKQSWKYVAYYRHYTEALRKAGYHDKAKEICDQGLAFFPENLQLNGQRLVCAISLNDTTEIQEYADRIRKIGEDQHWSEAKTESTLGEYYFRAQKEGALQADQAEKHVRRAYELEPGNTKYLENLAGLLIWCDINIDEGMQLSKDLLKIDPDNVWNLWYLGLGYHKQGLHKEAIELLERADDLATIYNGILQQHLREARQAYNKAG